MLFVTETPFRLAALIRPGENLVVGWRLADGFVRPKLFTRLILRKFYPAARHLVLFIRNPWTNYVLLLVNCLFYYI